MTTDRSQAPHRRGDRAPRHRTPPEKLLSDNRLSRAARTVTVAAALTAGASAVPATAQAAQTSPADGGHHYYVEIGGTGANVDGPACTGTYTRANEHLDGGIAVPVCYSASAGPWLNGHNQPDLSAPSFDASVREGYDKLLAAVEDTYHKDPDGRITIVGYSQGAQAADAVLETLANGGSDVPKEQVEGKLYADPKQPGTGAWAVVPKGVGAGGFTSTGAGPTDFHGIPVARYCIHGDLACDATTLQAIPDFVLTPVHAGYVTEGVIDETITQDGANGTFWYDS